MRIYLSCQVGTPFYLSPEICEDKPYDHKSDVWSLGCVLYELATLKRAFNGQSLPALVLKILRGKYPPLPSRYSANLRTLVDCMLKLKPQVRHAQPLQQLVLAVPFSATKPAHQNFTTTQDPTQLCAAHCSCKPSNALFKQTAQYSIAGSIMHAAGDTVAEEAVTADEAICTGAAVHAVCQPIHCQICQTHHAAVC